MNLVTLTRTGNSVTVGDFAIPLPVGVQAASVVMGIRPEHLRLPREGDVHTVSGQVFLVENLGMHDLVSLRVQGDPTLTLRALLPADASWSKENLKLALPPESIHWFDGNTEQRLG